MPDKDWQADVRALQQREKTAREILGVSDTDGPEQIKSAWRKLSLRHHPDNNRDSATARRRFMLVNCAYRFLTEGDGCKELDGEPLADGETTDGKYNLENPWGYFAWWQEKYFDR